MAKLLTRAEMLSAQLPTREVLVPEMGEDAAVLVRQMSVKTRQDFLERLRVERQKELEWEDDQALEEEKRKGVEKPVFFDHAFFAITLSLVDEAGQLLFTEEDMDELNGWSNNVIRRIFETIEDINYYRQSVNAAVSAEKKG